MEKARYKFLIIIIIIIIIIIRAVTQYSSVTILNTPPTKTMVMDSMFKMDIYTACR